MALLSLFNLAADRMEECWKDLPGILKFIVTFEVD